MFNKISNRINSNLRFIKAIGDTFSNLDYGSYVPNFTNASAITFSNANAHWVRVGDHIIVFAQTTYSASTGSFHNFDMSVPLTEKYIYMQNVDANGICSYHSAGSFSAAPMFGPNVPGATKNVIRTVVDTGIVTNQQMTMIFVVKVYESAT